MSVSSSFTSFLMTSDILLFLFVWGVAQPVAKAITAPIQRFAF
jgi:hypothetical protein